MIEHFQTHHTMVLDVDRNMVRNIELLINIFQMRRKHRPDRVFRVSILGVVIMVLGRYLLVGYLDP